jgi:hypothetical protein
MKVIASWLRFEANQWRADIAELQQGDGCCGFDLPLPEGTLRRSAACAGTSHGR